MKNWLPHPLLSAFLFLLWLLLANAASLAATVLALALALGLPLLTRRFWPDPPRTRMALLPVLRLAARVLWDILAANFSVARRILGPLDRLRPAFVDIPLDLGDPFAATLLSSIVSLTPGTVSVDLDLERRVLRVHGLDVPDPASLIRTVKIRYETPLMELFPC